MIAIRVNTKIIFRVMVFAVAALTFMYIVSQGARFFTSHQKIYGLISLFDLNGEGNIPAFYSSLQLLLAGILFTVIFYEKKIKADRYRWHWLGLSLIFFFLAMDEACSIHEMLVSPTRKLIHPSGFLYFAWIIPYMFILLIVAGLYLGFLKNLPRKYILLFGLSAFVYLSGAVGVELLEGRYVEIFGENNIEFSMYVAAEEVLELVGILLLVWTQIKYIKETTGIVQLEI